MILLSNKEKAYNKLQYKLSLAKDGNDTPFLAMFDIEYIDTYDAQERNYLIDSILTIVKDNISPNEVCTKWDENEFIALLFDADINNIYKKVHELQNIIQTHKYNNTKHFTLNYVVIQMINNSKAEDDFLQHIDKSLYKPTTQSCNHIHQNHWGL